MASWMVHLRVADTLLSSIPGLCPTEFVVGNIAPDSGVPNEDWSFFTPSKDISHFKTDRRNYDDLAFSEKYFTPELQESYDARTYSFFLGYLVHLLTDSLWISNILLPSKLKFADELSADKQGFYQRMKDDWYDLDYKFLRDHPSFRAFHIYQSAAGFRNAYMDEFSADAFDNRRQYIVEFYIQGKENLDRPYPYLTEAEMDAFTQQAADQIINILHTNYGILL